MKYNSRVDITCENIIIKVSVPLNIKRNQMRPGLTPHEIIYFNNGRYVGSMDLGANLKFQFNVRRDSNTVFEFEILEFKT